MVKITSSTIDIYTVVPNTAPLQRRQINMAAQQQQLQKQTPSTTNLRRKEYRQTASKDFSRETNELFYDSSDSETSFFDDSDDNDDVTAFFGRHAQNYRNLRNGEECSEMTAQQQKQHQFKNKRDIVKSCEMLASPRTERKNNNTLKQNQTTSRIQKNMEDLGFQPPSRNYSVPNLSSWNSSKKVSDEETTTSTFSPYLKRKQTTDITKSAAFKEIYAHNLRLYSKVLAKVRIWHKSGRIWKRPM